MFIAKNKVRMHDTDMAGILYFARQFRFVHDALEDLAESEGFKFDQLFRDEQFVFVIVHCEADYYVSLRVGDELTVELKTENIGTTSFTLAYELYKKDRTHVGSAKTVHVTLDRIKRTKIPIPTAWKIVLEKYL